MREGRLTHSQVGAGDVDEPCGSRDLLVRAASWIFGRVPEPYPLQLAMQQSGSRRLPKL